MRADAKKPFTSECADELCQGYAYGSKEMNHRTSCSCNSSCRCRTNRQGTFGAHRNTGLRSQYCTDPYPEMCKMPVQAQESECAASGMATGMATGRSR